MAKQTQDTIGRLEKLGNATDSVGKSMEHASNAVEKLTGSVSKGGKGFDNIISALKETDKMARDAEKALSLFENIPGVSTLSGFTVGLIRSFGDIAKLTAEMGDAYVSSLNAADSFSYGLRQVDDDMMSLTASFGGTFEEAKSFTDGINMLSTKVADAKFGYINPVELQETARNLAKARLDFEKHSETIVTTAGSMDLLTAATLQSKVSGLDDYYSKIGDAIMRQGLSSQGAMEQLASYSDISDKTGIKVSDVANNLNELANNFSKVGLSADFGRPLLSGFARTLDDMGLGIENALGLSTQLSSALANLTTDYSTAFVTAQRGGMDLGGGGVLGAGIQLQARLLESQQSGDEQEQAALSREMVTGLKDTIASFTGGQIVTVQDAAANPELEAAFYTQTKLLNDMYGIDEQAGARTLDMLSNLESAIQSGDEESANKLAEQIETSIQARDETLSLMDKQNALTTALLAETMSQSRSLMFLPRIYTEESLMEPASDYMAKGFDVVQDSLNVIKSKAFADLEKAEGDKGDFANKFADIMKQSKTNALARESAEKLAEEERRTTTGGEIGSSKDPELYGAIKELVRVLNGKITGTRSNTQNIKGIPGAGPNQG